MVVLDDIYGNIVVEPDGQDAIQDRAQYLIRKTRRDYFWNYCVREKCKQISRQELEVIFNGDQNDECDEQ